jgi:hypothetical protein
LYLRSVTLFTPVNESSIRNAKVLIQKVAKAATGSIHYENVGKGEDAEVNLKY